MKNLLSILLLATVLQLTACTKFGIEIPKIENQNEIVGTKQDLIYAFETKKITDSLKLAAGIKFSNMSEKVATYGLSPLPFYPWTKKFLVSTNELTAEDSSAFVETGYMQFDPGVINIMGNFHARTGSNIKVNVYFVDMGGNKRLAHTLQLIGNDAYSQGMFKDIHNVTGTFKIRYEFVGTGKAAVTSIHIYGTLYRFPGV